MLDMISPLGQQLFLLRAFHHHPPPFPLRLLPSNFFAAKVGKYIFPGGELPTLYLLTEDGLNGAEG